MKNDIKLGNVLTLTAPYDRLSGEGALVGSIFGVATMDVLSGAASEFCVTGCYQLKKTSALAFAVGELAYWDNTAKEVNKTSSGNKLIGVAITAAANPSATVGVRLNGAFVG